MTMTIPSVKERKKLSYFREVQNELKKVTWTSKEELFFSTKAVIAATFVFGFGIYLADLAIRGTLDLFGTVARLLFG
ncbi:MAG: preprotein translocase subunit SecE [Verrucomicrobiota bacterium]|nr:preprotein translocase subunit SecE [Verrucomicrobiota bacterium]